jgi:hypothetical protein
MLSGIWEILAARSHLYATPGIASPAIVRPPRRIVVLFSRGSLSPVERWQEPENADRRPIPFSDSLSAFLGPLTHKQTALRQSLFIVYLSLRAGDAFARPARRIFAPWQGNVGEMGEEIGDLFRIS